MNTLSKDELKEMTLAEIVTKNFATASVMHKQGLDFCCGGKIKMLEACEKNKVNSDTLLQDLSLVFADTNNAAENYETWELDALAEHIMNTHHGYVREKIPVIRTFAAKVENAHGKNHPETIEINRLFQAVADELTSHMFKEERILFPFIKQLAEAKKNGGKIAKLHFGTIANPIHMMELEHVNAGDSLHEINRLSNNYTPPEDACNTFNALYFELQAFENDLHKHIHLENNILFPKAIALEVIVTE